MFSEDLADTVEEAEDQLQEEASRSRRLTRTCEDLRASLRASALSDQIVAALTRDSHFWQTSQTISTGTLQGAT